MSPEANLGWPSEQQPKPSSSVPHNPWWKQLATHKLLLIAGAAGILLVGGIIFMFAMVKHDAESPASPTQPTTVGNSQHPSANSSNPTNPSATPNQPGQNPTSTPKSGSTNQTAPKEGSQGSTGTTNGGGTSNNNGGGGGNTGPVGCAVTTPHVPDGPDGMGGCWPGPSNTGPNASAGSMAIYGGSCTINSPNVTIDSKVVNCSPLTVGASASNLVIKNSYVNGGVISNDTATFTIQDSFINNAVSYPACSDHSCSAGLYACGDPNNATTDCGVGYKNFTILRTEIINSNRAAYCESTCTIKDSYFHGTNLWPDASNLAHASSVRAEQYLTLQHNALACDYTGPFNNGDIGCSADLSGYPDFTPILHNTIDKNLFMANNVGIGYCVYGGDSAGKPYSNDPTNATYIVFTNNVFQRGNNGICGAYGPATDFTFSHTGNVWLNNKYDNGTAANPS